jgi:hypothetical protein
MSNLHGVILIMFIDAGLLIVAIYKHLQLIKKIKRANIMGTEIFKNFDEFYNRCDKRTNGVSLDFARKHKNWRKMNWTNIACWNCLDCQYCNHCIGCKSCKYLENCQRCERCIRCCDSVRLVNCENCSDCYACENSENLSYSFNIKNNKKS